MSAAVEEYRQVIGRYGTIIDFDISALDRLGVPVTSCSLSVDGVLRHNGNGYGATIEAAALSGHGELAEGVLSSVGLRERMQDARRSSRRTLLRELPAGSVIDPRQLALPAGSTYTDETECLWVRLQRWPGGEDAWVPADFVANEPGEAGDGPSLITPVTNGLGAGLDRARSIVHGVLEIIQRDSNGLRFRALDARSPVLENASLPDSVRALQQRFAEQGVELIMKYAGTEFGVFSSYAVGRDRTGEAIVRTAGGEAAHPSAETSMIKSALEFANSRARKAFCFGADPRIREVAPAVYWSGLPRSDGEPRAVAAMRGWAAMSADQLGSLTAPDTSVSVRLTDLEGGGGPPASSQDELLDDLTAALVDQQILTATTRVGEVWVTKTLVTDLDVETLSYGRIGERGVVRSLEADLDLVRIQDAPTERHHDRVALTEAAEERLGGPAWYSYARADEIVGPLYSLYREPPRHLVAVGAIRPAPAPLGAGEQEN